MWTPQTLQQWYATDKGHKTAATVSQCLKETEGVLWQAHLKPLVLDVGYSTPYHPLFPTALIDHETPTNLGTNGHMECRYDRLLLTHALEDPAHDPASLLIRCWQALRPDGLLIALVPASFSLCRLGNGPYASGRCYTKSKLTTLLLETTFKPHTLTRTNAGVLLATARKHISGTKTLAQNPKTGRIFPIPAGIATFKG